MEPKALTKDALFAISEVDVRLTFKATNPPVEFNFPCKFAMSDDDEAARQAFYAKPDGDQKAGEYNYHVDLLSRICVREPDGLPEFELKSVDGPDGRRLQTVGEAIKAYFATETDMSRKIVMRAIELYNRVVEPAELFR